ncbi:MAG: Sialic acid TRAP transporter permease protein SiaT [Syntrophorhabdaceae bacterium PtaU1.Bin034]|nr:MAG: Sialic acid TRAP transporter permease protein SiaT [Syntrophorhabdaceae bacterium PtaU1.Bin034]
MSSITWKEFWSDKPVHLKVATVVAVALAVFQIYTALFGSLDAMMQRSIHLGLGLILVFMTHTTGKGKASWLDAILALAVVAAITYLLLNYEWVTVDRFSLVTPLFWYEKVLGIIALILVLESARRVVSPGLLYVSVAFIIYPFVAPFLPGLLRSAKTDWTAILDYNYVSTGGIFGIPLGVSATEIGLFIIFGAILMRSGGSTLISNISFVFAGRAVGGPAKVAVVGSSLFGTISGSGTANVATIGSVTIPMMKKAGYSANFAGAVEAVSSTGGQIMPPVMGAAAFVMAAFSGIPYSTILGYAIFPAVLYYVSLFFIVDLEARRLKLPLMKAEITLKETLRDYGHMIIPIAVLIYTLVSGFTPRLAGGYAIVAALVASQLRKTTRLSIPAMLSALMDGAKGMLIVVVSCATAGIIVGTVDMTGVGHRMGSAFIYLAGGNLTIGLILGLVVAFILGLGLPTTPAYILQVATVIPALIKLGLPVPAAHLFAFYYSCLALITPPDASAAFTAASIAKGDGWKTGWIATRMALVAFIVPFMFAYDQSLLLIGPVPKVILSVVTALIGVFCLCIGIEGYFRRVLAVWERVVAFIAALLLIAPGSINAVVGMALFGILFFTQRKGKRQVAVAGN